MAIINGNRFVKKEKIKIVISSEILAKIEEYCKWANIDAINFFIEEAACLIFAKDKDWKEQQSIAKRSPKNKTAATNDSN